MIKIITANIHIYKASAQSDIFVQFAQDISTHLDLYTYLLTYKSVSKFL